MKKKETTIQGIDKPTAKRDEVRTRAYRNARKNGDDHVDAKHKGNGAAQKARSNQLKSHAIRREALKSGTKKPSTHKPYDPR